MRANFAAKQAARVPTLDLGPIRPEGCHWQCRGSARPTGMRQPSVSPSRRGLSGDWVAELTCVHSLVGPGRLGAWSGQLTLNC